MLSRTRSNRQPQSSYSQARLRLLQDGRNITIRARILGVGSLLHWQHYIEQLLRQERRNALRGNRGRNGHEGLSVEEVEESEDVEMGDEMGEEAEVADTIEEIDLSLTQREISNEVEGSPRNGLEFFHPTRLEQRSTDIEFIEGVPSFATSSSHDNIVIDISSNVLDTLDGILESAEDMETLSRMVQTLYAESLPVIITSHQGIPGLHYKLGVPFHHLLELLTTKGQQAWTSRCWNP